MTPLVSRKVVAALSALLSNWFFMRNTGDPATCETAKSRRATLPRIWSTHTQLLKSAEKDKIKTSGGFREGGESATWRKEKPCSWQTEMKLESSLFQSKSNLSKRSIPEKFHSIIFFVRLIFEISALCVGLTDEVIFSKANYKKYLSKLLPRKVNAWTVKIYAHVWYVNICTLTYKCKYIHMYSDVHTNIYIIRIRLPMGNIIHIYTQKHKHTHANSYLSITFLARLETIRLRQSKPWIP